MLFSALILIAIGTSIFLYMKSPQFGRKPKRASVQHFHKLDNYKKGKFQNIEHTPDLTEGHSLTEVLYDYFFKKNAERIPSVQLPVIKTDLLKLPRDKDILLWFGHSSYFIQIEGKRFLIDPVLSTNASPIPGSNKSFKGTECYTPEDIPEIDYLLITHDHYDHVDYPTLLKIKNKVTKVVCGLGVAAHLERWGYAGTSIIEKNWGESVSLEDGFTIHVCPARHFSGRGISRNTTLWVSFALQSPEANLYLGGDSGYGKHFAEIGKKYGPFDLAILDNGQYDLKWKYIHMLPDEVLKAAKDLKARHLLPVHSSKFAMANHPWYEPLDKISRLNESENIPMLTPMIGEIVELDKLDRVYSKWWKEVR